MSEERAEALRDLRSYRSLLENLEAAGYEFAVIGGCAVSAYASELGEEIFSADLDLIVSGSVLSEMLAWARRQPEIEVTKTPQPRSVPVAVLFWSDLEVNVLTSSAGLPDAQAVTDKAREVGIDGLYVPIADPFDLLANKLTVRRERDLPHIEVLKRFVEAEIVATFDTESSPRRRLAPARRYLEIFGLDRLPEDLASQLLDRVEVPSDLRFLASSVPEALAPGVLAEAEKDPDLLAEVEEILALR